MKRKSDIIAAAAVIFLLLISGPQRNAVHAASTGESGLKAPADYRYNPNKKSDPFQTFVARELALKKKQETKKALSIYPLQRAAIDQFTLVGIVGNSGHRLAIVETKEGKGRFYPIGVGAIIGLNNGKVVEIKENSVIIDEEQGQGRAGKKINRIIKKLHKDEEEGTP